MATNSRLGESEWVKVVKGPPSVASVAGGIPDIPFSNRFMCLATPELSGVKTRGRRSVSFHQEGERKLLDEGG